MFIPNHQVGTAEDGAKHAEFWSLHILNIQAKCEKVVLAEGTFTRLSH